MKSKWIVCGLIGFAVISLSGCSAEQPEDIVSSNFRFAEKQLSEAFREIDRCRAGLTEQQRALNPVTPRSLNPDGTLRLSPAREWTSGFFPGELWYMYEYTQDPYWKQQADRFSRMIESEKLNGGTHDMGFKIYCSFGNGYRLTGDDHYRNVLLDAAATLCTRFNPTVGAIRSWDHNTDKWRYPVIIDNMMNLELLFWAFRQTNDSTYYRIAVSHADVTLRNHFRADYGTYHVVDYDPQTGAVVQRNTHQGYAHESTWARGEAWALYGYTMCYRETGLKRYLEQAIHVSQFIFDNKNLPEDLIPYWDYNAPNIPDEPRDVSAATVMASALYELSMYDSDHGELHRKRADTILSNITTKYRAKAGKERGFLLVSSTGAFPHDSEINVPIVYADYYFLESLLRKQKWEKEGNAVL